MNKKEAIHLLRNTAWLAPSDTLESVEEAVDMAVEALKERPIGKWFIDGHHIVCDQCGIYFCNSDREGDTLPRNFCPNCGARMSEREV